jgi:ectoine hydroxylase-related dioxygenase (phytanoyl-CoA dioxygenase family)
VQYFDKPPGTSRPTPAHQDGYYFHITPNKAVTMWLCIDPADAANGCLSYIKGSSKGPIRPHQPSGVLGFSQKCTDFGTAADMAAVKVMAAAPGDLVAHDSKMLHMAGSNTTKRRSRRAVGFIYFANSVRIDTDKAGARLHVALLCFGFQTSASQLFHPRTLSCKRCFLACRKSSPPPLGISSHLKWDGSLQV